MKKHPIRKKKHLGLRLLIAFAVSLLIFFFIGQKVVTEAQSIAEKRYKPELVIQIGHTSSVLSVAFSADGKTLALGSSDNTIKLWNIESGQQIKTLEDTNSVEPDRFSPNKDSNSVWSVAFSPDGKTLASGSSDKTIDLWDVETGQQIKTFKGYHDSSVWSVTFSPDGKTLVSGSSDKTIKLWNTKSGDLIRTFEGHGSLVLSVVFSPDGKTLVSGSWDKTIKLWNIESGREIKTLAGHTDSVYSVAFSPDGRTLVSGSADKTIKLWDVGSGSLMKSFEGHRDSVRAVVLSADGKMLASGSWDKTIKLWNVESGMLVSSLEAHTSPVWSVVFSPNEKTLVSGSGDATTRLWNVENNQLLATLTSINRNDWMVSAPDGNYDASPAALELMYYAVSVPGSNDENITLDQLKSRSSTPRLLRDIYEEKRNSGNSKFSIALPPDLEIEQSKASANLLNLKLKNRGGGIGYVEVRLNATEIIRDVRRGKNVDAQAAVVTLPVEIPPEKLRDGENKVEIIVWNLEGDVRSRKREVFINLDERGAISKGTGVYRIEQQKKPSEINFYAIVAGVSDYAGDALDLRYAAKDAEDISKAIMLAARRYFCNDEVLRKESCERVHLKLLSTEKDPQAKFTGLADVPDFKRLAPKKQNFREAFAEVSKQSKPEDVVFIYLSGHGTAITSDEAVRESLFAQLYLYPTADATTLDQNAMRNQSTREAVTVNSLELKNWVTDIKAAKKLMIFDTCAAGAAQKNLVAQIKGTEEDRLQILSLDRLRERTGFYILTGSAADGVSYEANEYRQGLLTYSLIEAMTVDTMLEDGRFLDVEKWFGYAEGRVEILAKGIGNVQKPSFFKGESKTFSVGRIEADERKNIQLPRKVPLILQPELRDPERRTDKEHLTDKLERRLWELSKIVTRDETVAVNYIKATNATNGLSPRGFYTVAPDGTITVEISLIRDEEEIAKIKVSAKREEIIEVLIKEIVKMANIQEQKIKEEINEKK